MTDSGSASSGEAPPPPVTTTLWVDSRRRLNKSDGCHRFKWTGGGKLMTPKSRRLVVASVVGSLPVLA